MSCPTWASEEEAKGGAEEVPCPTQDEKKEAKGGAEEVPGPTRASEKEAKGGAEEVLGPTQGEKKEAKGGAEEVSCPTWASERSQGGARKKCLAPPRVRKKILGGVEETEIIEYLCTRRKGMHTVEALLKDERKRLLKVAEDAKKRLEHAPKGYLKVKKKRGGFEYYFKEEKNGGTKEKARNHYLRKNEILVAKGIAQRDYDAQLYRMVESRLQAIDSFLESYGANEPKSIYEKTTAGRKKLLSDVLLSDEDYAKQWQAVEYKGKGFEDEESCIYTEKGERVRSKSEKIIADKLFHLGIPYRYEYPLFLDGGIKVYPDFTILRVADREEFYLEHFGMMDDTNYAEGVMRKLNNYEKNGIYLGVNLFATYETRKKPLNIKVLDELARCMLCR